MKVKNTSIFAFEIQKYYFIKEVLVLYVKTVTYLANTGMKDTKKMALPARSQLK